MSTCQKYTAMILSICLAITLASSPSHAHDCNVKAQHQALTESIYSDVFIKNWTSIATADVMTFGFHDYKKRLRKNSSYFTRTGWNGFTTALEKSRIIESVIGEQQVVSAAIKGVPLIQSSGVIDKQYQWVVVVPLMVSYQKENKLLNQPMTVQIKILRSNEGSSDGIGIEQWIVTN